MQTDDEAAWDAEQWRRGKMGQMEMETEDIEAEAIAAIVKRFEPGSMDNGNAADCLAALNEAGFSVVRTEAAIKAGLVMSELQDDDVEPSPY